MMEGPSSMNPLRYVLAREYKGGPVIKKSIFQERLDRAKNFYQKDLFAHYGCVNAVEFSNEGELLVSGGDDRRVLLWSVPRAIYNKGTPTTMTKTHNSNIFCVALDSKNKKIFSGGNDDQVIIHEVNSTVALATINHRKPVYGLSVNPENDDVITTACEDGRLLQFDVREGYHKYGIVIATGTSGFHSVMYSPTRSCYLVSANSEEGVALWDNRKPQKKLVEYDDTAGGVTSGISACFDSTGTRVLALRRRLPPVLYNLHDEYAICQFYHPQYYNSCTMKTCSFAGDSDEYVLSGSDDFNLYMWKIPTDSAEWGASHVVLSGHRSIVNQVRYNKHNNLIASSGVEKMIKLWSALPIGTWKGSLLKESTEPTRIIYSHQEYVELVGSTGERISHDYSDQSTTEDCKMMAFFDSLIQREIEGWNVSVTPTESESEDEHEWTALAEKMYPNGHYYEEPKRAKTNKIAQLIWEKRTKLAKMAYNKTTSALTQKLAKRSHILSELLDNLDRDEEREPENGVEYDEPSLASEDEEEEDDVEVENNISTAHNGSQRTPTENGVANGKTQHNGGYSLRNHQQTNNGASTSIGRKRKTTKHWTSKRGNNSTPLTNNTNGQPSEEASNSEEDNYEFDYQTPTKRLRNGEHSDSGCGTGPSSSKHSSRSRRSSQRRTPQEPGPSHASSDEEVKHERFRKRVRKVRANIRKTACIDSDSN